MKGGEKTHKSIYIEIIEIKIMENIIKIKLIGGNNGEK